MNTTTKRAGWRCHTCGARFVAWAPAERHGSLPGHHRIDCIIRTVRPAR